SARGRWAASRTCSAACRPRCAACSSPTRSPRSCSAERFATSSATRSACASARAPRASRAEASAARFGTFAGVRQVCFYHAGCPDGFGAAWAVWRAWGDEGRYVPRGHEDGFDPWAFDGDVVVFVDIAPPPEALGALSEVAAQLVVLDHHVSARDRYAENGGFDALHVSRGHRLLFARGPSGGMPAGPHSPAPPAPPLLRYVEDQDLWSWELPDSEAVNAAIGSYPRDFATWSALAARSADELAAEG